jgi:hypothetical protein
MQWFLFLPSRVRRTQHRVNYNETLHTLDYTHSTRTCAWVLGAYQSTRITDFRCTQNFKPHGEAMHEHRSCSESLGLHPQASNRTEREE